MKNPRVGTDVSDVRMTNLKHIIGQKQVVDTLRMNLEAHFKMRSISNTFSLSMGPVLLTGPSGTGKTVVAKALHGELGNLKLLETNGVTINRKGEIYSLLFNVDENTTLFIDEAQAMNSKTQHILLTAISEKILHIPMGISSSLNSSINLPHFTLIFATTHEHLLQDALRNRMRIYCRFELYTVEELVEIIRQRAHALKWRYESDEVLNRIARCSKGVPRIALNRYLQTCWCVAVSNDRQEIQEADVRDAFNHLQIDEKGLDKTDKSYLQILIDSGPTTLSVLSSKLALPSQTLQTAIEPYLFREGYIVKNNASRRLIEEKGKKHMASSSSWEER